MNSLGNRSTFTDGNNITFLDSETWRTMSDNVGMSLFVSIILFDKVEIISSNNKSVFHLVWDNHSSKDFSSDADISSEWTFFINIVSLNSFFGSFEAKSNIFVISDTFSSFRDKEFLVVLENTSLFLIGVFFLFDHVKRFIIFRFII